MSRIAFTIIIILLIISCTEAEEQLANKSVTVKSSNNEDSYKLLKIKIDDYNWIEETNRSTNISYLENFDQNNIDHWRAIIEYGFDRSNVAMQLGKSRLIFFTNTSKIEKQYDISDIGDYNYTIVFAMYQSLPNGNELFSINPFGSFDESYFKTLLKNKELINKHHNNVID